jgi:hypothetical protein
MVKKMRFEVKTQPQAGKFQPKPPLRSRIQALQSALTAPSTPWCNGNTGDFDSLVQGSNPCGVTTFGEARFSP